MADSQNTPSTCEKTYELSTDQRAMLRAVALALHDVQEEAAEDVNPDTAEILSLCRCALLGLCRQRQQPRGEVIRMRLAEVNHG